MPSAPPKVVSAEVVATQPTDADTPMIAGLSAETNTRLSATAFVVKIQLETLPEPTGDGWALYVGDTRIPKYWEYPGGIYFKVLDETFLAEHQGEPLRFSQDGEHFVKTGVKLPGARVSSVHATRRAGKLPLQSDVLSGRDAARGGQATKKPTRRAATKPRQVRRSKTRKSR